jgi:hypothetical protein
MPKKNQQKWLTDQISGDWQDKDRLIDTILVQCLFHYVEHELKGVIPDRGYYDIDLQCGYVSQKYVDSNYAFYDDIRKAYNYFKFEHDALEQAVEETADIFTAETELYDRDTEMLNIIVKHRGCMWT